MNPQVRYAQTVDDVSIAFWTYGEGPVLVEAPLVPFSHIELEWHNPHIRRWYERLGRLVTVVRYDGRGTGLSQRVVDDVSIEGQVRDLEAVIGSIGSDPVSLMGVFHSGPAAVVSWPRGFLRLASSSWTANRHFQLREILSRSSTR